MFQIKNSISDDGWIMYIPSMIPNFPAVSLEKVKVMWNYFNAIFYWVQYIKNKILAYNHYIVIGILLIYRFFCMKSLKFSVKFMHLIHFTLY